EYFHIVRLNGFIQTDDKLALREIWRQLGREMSLEEDEGQGRSNYADMLHSLLALLSHSPEAAEGEVAPDLKSKAIVFVLNEFDLFASHPRQTLLYNLFDVAQSSQAPIAVLGLTTKINVVEMLEKRVKSRFSQRYVHLSLPKTFSTFNETCKAALLPPPPSLSARLQKPDSELETLHEAWKTYITDLFSTPSMVTHLRTIYSTTASLQTFYSSALIPISLHSPIHLPISTDFTTHSLLPSDNKLSLLPTLSDLALSLLIAAARLDIILSTDLCTFAMAYDEYVSLASRLKQQTSASGQLALGNGGR
ncbi:MAG: hypothetical protein Q9191_008574, partial [Dirinaria sp. TL-2023a]